MKNSLQFSCGAVSISLVFVLHRLMIITIGATKCGVYNIPSSTNLPCVDDCSCVTLSQFAANSSHLVTQNTTLMLLPGVHTLNVNFTVSEVSLFSIKSVCDDRTKVIIKFAKSVSFYFDLILNVNIADLTLIGVVSSISTRMLQVKNKNSGNTSSTAIVVKKSTLKISNTSFKWFGGSSWRVSSVVKKYTRKRHMLVGGAIIISETNITIYNSFFQNNTAQLGGALYAESRSNVTIMSSYFFDHSTICKGHCHGGVIFLDYSKVECIACTISNNRLIMNVIHHWEPSGGVFASFNGSITVKSSIFMKNFASFGGVLRCLHCNPVIISNTTFLNNIAKQHGGIAYIIKSPFNIINDSCFIQNAALSRNGGVFWIEDSKLFISNSGFHNNTANITGGAINCAAKCIINLSHSNFTNNKAIVYNSSGGAIFTVRSVVDTDSSIFVGNSAYSGGALLIIYSLFECNGSHIFMNNTAIFGVFTSLHSSGVITGELLLKYNTGSLFIFDTNLNCSVADAIIINNRQSERTKEAKQGGGITSILSSAMLNGPMLLKNNHAFNGGAILAVSSSIFLSGSNNVSNNGAADTGGGIYLYHSELVIQGETNIANNKATKRGGGIHSVSSSIVLRLVYYSLNRKPLNYLTFISNTAKEGGGLCLEVSSKFFVVNSKNKALIFRNNSADKGGAIYVADDTNTGTCTSSQKTIAAASESECFFQPLETFSQSHPVILEQLIILSHNTAVMSGAVLFGGLLDRCTINNKKYSYQKDFVHLIVNDTASAAVRVCLCYNNMTDCSYRPKPYKVRKGESFVVPVVAVDQVNHTLSANIHSFVTHRLSHLYPGQQDQMANSFCTNLTFQVNSPKDMVKLNLYADGPCQDRGISNLQLQIDFLPCICPVGFQQSRNKDINNSTCKCDCDPQLYPFITKCNFSTNSIIRQCDVWITALSNTSYLIYPYCPLNYCFPPTQPVSVNLSDHNGADAQCAFSRSGKLCGTCKHGLSLSLGSSRCLQCPSYWPALFTLITMGAILAGIVLVATLLMLKLTVVTGTLNGLIFFANIIDANSSVFIPFHKVNFSTVFIAWLNLDFGFDVCYFKGMDAYSKSWLEFAFPSYIILLVLVVIKLCQHSTVFSQLIGKRNPVATLATLILLSFAKLLQNIINVASFAILKYPDGTHELVWRPDATVLYLQGKHLPLFLAAVVILILGINYTFLLFSWQWINQLPAKRFIRWIWNTKLISFMDAYHAPYRPKRRYWTGLLLFSRAILYIISSVNVSGEPSLNLMALVIVVAFLWLLKGDHTYKKWPADVLESGFYLNILILCATKFYVLQKEGRHAYFSYISIGTSFIMFVCIVCYHTFTESSCSVAVWIKGKIFIIPQAHDEHARLLDSDV